MMVAKPSPKPRTPRAVNNKTSRDGTATATASAGLAGARMRARAARKNDLKARLAGGDMKRPDNFTDAMLRHVALWGDRHPHERYKYPSIFQVKIGVSSRLTPEKSSRTRIAFRKAASSRRPYR